MRSMQKLLLVMISIMLLTSSLAGCGLLRREVIVIKNDERINPHPTDENQLCLDKGYLVEIFEELGK